VQRGDRRMKRVIMIASILFLLLSTLVFNGFVVMKVETDDAGFAIMMSVNYCNNGTEKWVFTEEDRAIGLFMNNTWQTVYLTYHSRPLERQELDVDGNPIAVLQFPTEIEPAENVSYTVTYHAFSKPRLLPNIEEEDSGTLDAIPPELKERYCGKGDAWMVDDPELRELAYDLKHNETKVLTIVKGFVEWIRQNITYAIHEVPLYPNETLAMRNGDCDDQAILFITLCRICQIPSYLQIGCVYDPAIETNETFWEGHVTDVSRGIGWHGWAMVYIPPWGWLPVDLTFWHFNPLNAIKTAAVTSQTVIQYMNVSQMDYVASSLAVRGFLIENNFYVYTENEMTQIFQKSPWEETIEGLFSRFLISSIVIVGAIIAGIFMHILKEKKLKPKPI